MMTIELTRRLQRERNGAIDGGYQASRSTVITKAIKEYMMEEYER